MYSDTGMLLSAAPAASSSARMASVTGWLTAWGVDVDVVVEVAAPVVLVVLAAVVVVVVVGAELDELEHPARAKAPTTTALSA